MTATPKTSERPLRVAIVASRFPIGSETFVSNIAAGLVERGHDVSIHAAGGGGRAPVHEIVNRAGLLDRRIIPPAGGAPLAGRAAALLRGFGLGAADVVSGRTPRPAALHATPLLAALAMTFAGRGDYDVLHAQFGPLGSALVRLRDAGMISGRIVTHFRGYDLSRYVRRSGAAVYRRLFEAGDLFMPNCRFFRDTLLELGCDPARTTIHRSGIDLRLFSFRAPDPIGDRAPRLLTLGRLTEKKGIDIALRALAALRAGGRACTLSVVGDGPRRPALEQLAGDLGLGDAVRFHGGIVQEEAVDMLRAADLFIAASVTPPSGDRDGPVNTLKEAMATGVPSVGTRHGGIPELIEDGVTGRLVEEGDPEALATGIATLLDERDHWAAMAAAARARIEADYDLEVLNDRLVNVYRRVVAGEAPDGAKPATVPTDKT